MEIVKLIYKLIVPIKKIDGQIQYFFESRFQIKNQILRQFDFRKFSTVLKNDAKPISSRADYADSNRLVVLLIKNGRQLNKIKLDDQFDFNKY